MKVVILAAGRGKRLGNSLKNIPKCMVELNSKPLLEHSIETLKEEGFEEFVIVVGYKKDEIMDYFKDGSELGVKIDYAIQEKFDEGTAKALECVKGFIGKEKFILFHGDNIYKDKITRLLLENIGNCDGMFCSIFVADESLGTLKIEDGLVKKISENAGSNYQSQGLAILPPEVFSAISETEPNAKGEYGLPDSIQILIDKGYKFGNIVTGKILNINTEEDLELAKELFKQH